MKLGPWQKAWVKTLKSGKFNQCHENLCIKDKNGYNFCCLGIANEVFIENGVRVKVEELDCLVKYDDCQLQLSDKQYKRLGLYDPNGGILRIYLPHGHKFDKFASLAEANDEGCTFEEIAEALEKYPKAFFYSSK